MSNLPFRFFVALLFALVLVFVIHIGILYFLNFPMWDNLLLLSYIVNFVLALGIFYLLYFLRIKLSNAIGFLFMGGSLLKFIVFFLVFYPVYKSDQKMQGIEFAAFFIPYAISLVLETYFASKMLKKIEQKS